MRSERVDLPIALSDTGPLISIFQSDSLDLLLALFSHVGISETCVAELTKHGWYDDLVRAAPFVVSHRLTESESAQARELARRIATHPASKDPEPANHWGEAEVMLLAERHEFDDGVLLLDELAARGVAVEIGLRISGFAGVLLLAAGEGLLNANEVKARMERCSQQGTHYSRTLIERVFQAARESEK